MEAQSPVIKIGYVVKMYPRLSETFIMNEILEMERRGAEVTIFSYKKPNEGQFHPQVSQVKARAYYMEDLDPRKWPQWLSKIWPSLNGNDGRLWRLVSDALACNNLELIDLILASG